MDAIPRDREDHGAVRSPDVRDEILAAFARLEARLAALEAAQRAGGCGGPVPPGPRTGRSAAGYFRPIWGGIAPDEGPDPIQEVGLSVVAPCYNERDVIPEFYRRMDSACRPYGDYEILLVNDGSYDGTWDRLLEIASRDPRVISINLSRNYGHQLALTAGLACSRGRRVLIIDADLQDPPELLPEMMRIMDSGADVVYGVRRSRAGEGVLKVATAALFYRLIGRLTDVAIPRDAGDFRLLSRRAVESLRALPERRRFLRGMVSWIGFRQEPLPYDRQARYAGSTKYPFGKMIRLGWDAVTEFSAVPLTIASWLGAAMGLFAAALLVYSIASWAAGGTVVGWTSLMAALATMGSAQFLILGIGGEYLGRIYEEAKGRPLFVIESIVRHQAKADDGARQ